MGFGLLIIWYYARKLIGHITGEPFTPFDFELEIREEEDV